MSSGKKATANWICKNLFNPSPSLAADVLKKLVAQKRMTLGMFTALHPFGRDLKRNVHTHLSVILGGLINNNTKWNKNVCFHHATAKKMRCYALINLL